MSRPRDRAFAAQEPAGFVFEEATTEREPQSRAAALLAAAGAPVVVLDGADDVKVGDVLVLLCARMVTCGSYAKETDGSETEE